MTRSHTEWYRSGLGPRIDALNLALNGILNHDPKADQAARNVSQSLLSSSQTYDLPEIQKSAREVVESSREDLADRVRALIGVLRADLSQSAHDHPVILIVGGEETFRKELANLLAATGKQALAAETGRDANRIAENCRISLIVMDMFLPDQDGRHYIRALHSHPLTAAIPIIAIDAPIRRQDTEADLLKEADLWLTKPVEAGTVADLIHRHLRRAHEIVRGAWRDQLTGLLNRAAFHEAFDQTLATHEPTREPIAMAMIGVDKLDEIRKGQGEESADQILQHVSSLLSVSFRATDLMARWDAGHFAVMFPGEDYFGGVCALEKSMAALAQRPFLLPDGQFLPLTLSAGLIVISDRIPCHEAADNALNFLYLAEMEGGGRIQGHDSTPANLTNTVAVIMKHSPSTDIVRHLLQNDRFEVMTINEFTDPAWAELARLHFQLIVIGDPDGATGGTAILEKLRALPQFNRTPIIMLVSTGEEAVRAMELGANDYLIKPFAPQFFTSHLRRVMANGVTKRHPDFSILVVDDEVSSLVIAGTTLGKLAGFQVRLAYGATDGITRLAEDVPDVILINHSLRDMAPNDFLARARTTHFFGRKTMVLLAAEPAHREQAGRLVHGNLKMVISKPYFPQTLLKEVSEALHIPLGQPAAKPDTAKLNSEIQRVIMRSTPPRP